MTEYTPSGATKVESFSMVHGMRALAQLQPTAAETWGEQEQQRSNKLVRAQLSWTRASPDLNHNTLLSPLPTMLTSSSRALIRTAPTLSVRCDIQSIAQYSNIFAEAPGLPWAIHHKYTKS